MKYNLKKIIAAVVIIATAAVIYFLFSPEDSGFFPRCPFNYATGLDCPGCGSQRAMHHLLHLEIKEAFFYNPMLVVAIPFILIGVYLEYFGGKEKHPKLRNFFLGRYATIIILVLVISYWIGRNIVKYM